MYFVFVLNFFILANLERIRKIRFHFKSSYEYSHIKDGFFPNKELIRVRPFIFVSGFFFFQRTIVSILFIFSVKGTYIYISIFFFTKPFIELKLFS